MPYPYTLPTTSPSSFTPHYASPVYPSLPLLASQHRGTVRNLLKAFKRLSPAQQPTHLPQLFAALSTYLPHLLFLQSSLHAGDVLPSDAATAFTPSWRITLTPPPFPGAPPKRVEHEGLEFEIMFTLSTLAYTHTLLSRSQLHDALSPKIPTDKKQQLLNTAIQHLLTSASIFTHSLSLPLAPGSSFPSDLSPATLSALSSLSLADATLLAVTKQDPYPSYLALTSGKKSSSEYLYTPPAPPTGVKALLLARICIAASTHAEKALGILPSEVVPELGKYLDSLHHVARAKACRFLAIDAEASGRVGEGIGWIVLARSILTPSSSKLKRGFLERRETRALEKGDMTWGMDAGRLEEGRVLEGLEEKWRKNNDAVFFQQIEAESTLAARIPRGREVHTVKGWDAPTLDAAERKSLLGKSIEGLAEGVEALGWGDSDDEAEEKEVPGAYKRTTTEGGYY
ncbi:hypothetical protein K440DRAFT_586263 [Wilcoxina mikolae CBS 423.85]|nr:hypothetical protein K440DRAFT_586263 [Wilcoxina mikolae CBS 423.85]